MHYLVANTSLSEIPKTEAILSPESSICNGIPVLNGTFSDRHEEFRHDGTGYTKVGTGTFGDLKITSMLKNGITNKQYEIDKVININHRFQIISEDQSIRIISYNRKKPIAYETAIDVNEIGFSCSDGKLIYPIDESFGGAEGTLINVRVYRELYISNDGSLVLYLQRSNSRNSVFSPNDSGTEHYLYVYKPYANTL